MSPNAYPTTTAIKNNITITEVEKPFTVTFAKTDDPFSVHEPGIINNPGLPLGHGTTTIRGTATYTEEGVTVSVTVVSTNINIPSTVTVKYRATIQVDSRPTYELKLSSPTSSIIGPNSSIVSGSRNISDISLGMQVSLEITPIAYDRDTSKIKALPNKVVVPWAWSVNLGTGTISRYNWYIR